MASAKIEFAVQMSCNSCVEAVKNSLKSDGINSVEVNLKSGTVVVETKLSTHDVLKLLEKSGRKAVVKGFSGSVAAVAILEAGNRDIQGVVRLMQIQPDLCVIDGTIDGLEPGKYRVTVHECGDISQGCESVGEVYKIKDKKCDLGDVDANQDGRAAFRLEDNILDLKDCIGRSLVISEIKENGERLRLACGILARSSGLFQNPKMICACDGVSIWDERNKPKSKYSNL